MSAGLTATSALLSGVSRYEAGEERSQLYRANADIAARQAQSEAEAGAFNENTVRMRGAALEGQQVAQIGADNLQQTGTPAQVVAGTRMISEMDALRTRNNALRRAWGFRVQQVSDIAQAGFAQRAGIGAGTESLLTGGAKAYSEYEATGAWF
jgi:hypothetical protein